MGWIPNVEYASLWVALERNYLKGSQVKMQYLPGGPNAPQPTVLVSARQADMGDAEWLPLVEAIQQGNDFVVLCAFFPILPTGLLSLPRRPVRVPADLPGARFLVQGPSERRELDATFRLNKLPLDYKLIPVGFSPEPLLEGQGDAYFCFITNQPFILQRMGMQWGRDFYVTRIFDLGYRVPSSLLFVDRATLQKKRPMLVAFLKAMLRGHDENAKDPSVAAHLCAEKFGGDLGLDVNQQMQVNRAQIPLQIGEGAKIPFWFSASQMESMYRVAEAVGKRNLPSPSQVFDLSLLEEAYRELEQEKRERESSQKTGAGA